MEATRKMATAVRVGSGWEKRYPERPRHKQITEWKNVVSRGAYAKRFGFSVSRKQRLQEGYGNVSNPQLAGGASTVCSRGMAGAVWGGPQLLSHWRSQANTWNVLADLMIL